MSNRNRVLEETWEAQRYVVEMKGDAGRQIGQFIDDADDPDWPSCDRDRAQLASVAPEMVRLLLSVEWDVEGFDSRGDSSGFVCLFCANGADHGHAGDCALDAVLRKAGVPRADKETRRE
jgi:hypothetical protein